MPRVPALLASCLLLALVETGASGAAELEPGAATAVQRAAKLRVSREDCLRLIEHVAAADVAYTPGVDARGRPVAPADLPGSARVIMPEEFVIELDVALQTLLGIVPPPGVDLEVKLGKIQVRGNKVFLNGAPLFDVAQARLAEECRARFAR